MKEDEKGRKYKLSFGFVTTRCGTKNAKKKLKKLKKLKNIITASFQAKIVWKRARKRENKNYRFFPFLPDAL